MGPWNKPERHFLARGFMPRKPVDRRRAERDSNGLPSGNIDLKQRKDWSIWADKMISSRGIYNVDFGELNEEDFCLYLMVCSPYLEVKASLKRLKALTSKYGEHEK